LPTAHELFLALRNHEYAFNFFKKIYATVVSVRRRHDAHVRWRHLRGERWPGLQPADSRQTIPLDGVEGRIDHFGLDAKGKRLFVSALGNDTVEVVDLAAGKVTQHIRNLRAPQGIGFAPESNRLAVANDQDG
jgi:hypothetical protein